MVRDDQVQAGHLTCFEVHGALQLAAHHLFSSIQGEGAGRSIPPHHSQLQIPSRLILNHAGAARFHVQNVRPGAFDGDLVVLSGQIHPMSAANVTEPERSIAHDVWRCRKGEVEALNLVAKSQYEWKNVGLLTCNRVKLYMDNIFRRLRKEEENK